MAAKVRLLDGREITVALSAKRVLQALAQGGESEIGFTQFNTATNTKVWISRDHVVAIEDRPDLD